VLVLNYKVLADIDKVLAEKDINDPAIINRKKACVDLIFALQRQFSLMLLGNKNVVDPTEVMKTVVDGTGSKINIGE